MTGCQPWPARPIGARVRTVKRPDGTVQTVQIEEICPTCLQGIQEHDGGRFCATSNEFNADIEARLKSFQADFSRHQASVDQARHSETEAKYDLGIQQGAAGLSEKERRRWWFGRPLKGNRNVVNPQDICRKWLAEKGQLPRWDWILDRGGKRIGFWSEMNLAVETYEDMVAAQNRVYAVLGAPANRDDTRWIKSLLKKMRKEKGACNKTASR
jgi:hypothetical protein